LHFGFLPKEDTLNSATNKQMRPKIHVAISKLFCSVQVKKEFRKEKAVLSPWLDFFANSV